MAKVNGKLLFVAGAVCFINSWSLAEKLGTDMDRIHAPVPQYATDISRPSSGFMDRLMVGRPFWRVNWGMSDNPDLFKPEIEALRLKPDDGADGQSASCLCWKLHLCHAEVVIL